MSHEIKKPLTFLILVVFAVLAQTGWYYLLTLFGLRDHDNLLFFLTIISGAAFWYLPFWYTFVYSRQQKKSGTDIKI